MRSAGLVGISRRKGFKTTVRDRDARPAPDRVQRCFTAERDELSRLRRENRQLKLEREILSKAAAWFARETDVIPPKGSNS